MKQCLSVFSCLFLFSLKLNKKKRNKNTKTNLVRSYFSQYCVKNSFKKVKT